MSTASLSTLLNQKYFKANKAKPVEVQGDTTVMRTKKLTRRYNSKENK